MRTRMAQAGARIAAVVGVLVAAPGLMLARPGPARADGLVTDCTEQGLANAMNAGSGLITFACGPNPVVIPWTVSQDGLNVGPGYACADCTIDGGNKVTLSGAGAHRLFDVRVNGALTLTNIILTDGFTQSLGNLPTWGGAILDEGNSLVLDHVTLQNSFSEIQGGALMVVTGTAVITDSLIENNRSAYGGGIESLGTLTLVNTIVRGNQALLLNGGGLDVGGTVLIQNSQIVSNTAAGSLGPPLYGGGGISITFKAQVSISGSRLDANSTPTLTTSYGGAILNTGTLTVTDSSLTGNTAANGGGLANYQGALVLDHVTLSGNQASVSGGGIRGDVGSLLLDHATLSGNQASVSGGGIDNEGGALTVRASTLSGNSAVNEGGGIYNASPEMTLISDSTLSANSATAGGGLYSTSSVSVNGSTFAGNTAQNGAGLYNTAGAANLTNVTLSGNTATNQGGGIFSYGDESLTNVTLSGNSAAIGGALDMYAGHTTLINTVLAYSPVGGNCAGTLSAAAYSLSSDNSCALTGLVHGHDPNGLDPLLTALGNYGGPTRVHMLKLGSPAIAGVVGNAAPATDQRGQPRPGPDGSFDIGAVERQPADSDLAPWLWLPLVRR